MPGAILIKVRPGRVKAFGHFADHAEHEGRVAIRFNPAKHPRDRHGRFITVGGDVRLGNGSVGKVIHDLGDGYVEVRQADGSTVSVHAHSLEVVQPPPIGRFTGRAADKPGVAEVRMWDTTTHQPDHVEDRKVSIRGLSQLPDAESRTRVQAAVRDALASYSPEFRPPTVKITEDAPSLGADYDQFGVRVGKDAVRIHPSYLKVGDDAKLRHTIRHEIAHRVEEVMLGNAEAEHGRDAAWQHRDDTRAAAVAWLARAKAEAPDDPRIEYAHLTGKMKADYPGQLGDPGGEALADLLSYTAEGGEPLPGDPERVLAMLANGPGGVPHVPNPEPTPEPTPQLERTQPPPQPLHVYAHPGTAQHDIAMQQAIANADHLTAVRHLRQMDKLEAAAGVGPDDGLRPKIAGTIRVSEGFIRDKRRDYRAIPKGRETQARRIATTASQVITQGNTYTRTTPEQAGQTRDELNEAAAAVRAGDHEGALRHLSAAREAARGPAGTMVMTSGPDGRGAIHRIEDHEQDIRQLAYHEQALQQYAPAPKPPPKAVRAAPEGPQDLAGLRLPRGRKLAVLHGPSNELAAGYVENGDGELTVRRTRGGEITAYIPHNRVNVIGETAGHAGQANPVAWRRPDARAEPVLASQVAEGHTIMAPHPTGPPAPATIIGRADSGRTVSLTVRRADGSVDTVNLDRTYTVDRIEAGFVPEEFPDEVATVQPEPPPPLIPALPPAGVLIARPPLYTYQRQKIVALGLDADKTQPPAVRQAAALARLRLPMTGDQAAALADAVQLASTRKGTRPVQARALGRISYRLIATADEVRGSAPPQLPGGRAGAESTAARDLTEGDTVALAAHGADQADVVTVRGITATMGGRVVTADLEHQDGTRETRTLTGRTRAWLLPDPAADKPVPPPGPHLEHILPDRLRPGDTIRDGDGAPRQVTKVEPSKSGTPLTFDVSYIGGDGDETVGRFRSADGGPAVVRTTRGPGSQDQPWDQVMPAEHPQTGVLPAEIRVGDRLAVRGWQGPMTGEVQAVKTVKLKGSQPGVTVTLRLDTGYSTDVNLYDDTADRVTRLIKADDNAAARIETVRAARLERLRAAQIRGTLDDVVTEQRRVDLAALGPWMAAPDDEVREAITRTPIEDQMLHVSAPGLLIRALIPDAYDSDAGGDKIEMMARERIQPVITQIAQRSRDNLVQSLEAATAGLSDPAEITAARQRVAGQFAGSPPPLDTGQVAQALAAAAAAMREAAGITDKPDAAAPDLPEDADLAARVAAYKAALPDPAYIGHRQVVRAMFAPPVLADLEAGRAPAVQEVTVAVPDRAEDGGPGAIASRHLDIVMAAGRDLDAELQRRMAGAGGITPERQAEHDAATARLSEVASERFRLRRAGQAGAENAAMAAYVHERGFRDYNDVLDQMVATRGLHSTDADHAEWYRLREIREAARSAGRAAFAAAGQRQEDLAAERDALKARQLTGRELADARRVAALSVLGEVRPDGLGGAQARYKPASGNADREYDGLLTAARWAEQHYPTSWLQKYRDRAPDGYSLGTVGRGFYQDWSRQIMMSESPGAQVTGGSPYDHVAIHEEGHAMERAVPGLAALEDAYLWSRTSSGEMGSRQRTERTALGAGYEADEYSFLSDLPERYTSKTYSSSGTTIDPSYELFTTGIESLFAGSNYLDTGFRQWLLGTLATL